MKKISSILKKITIILFLPLSASFANDLGIKQINAVSEEWEDATNKDGTGLYWEIIKKVFEPLGAKINLKTYPYERSVKFVEQQDADFWVGAYADEEDFAIFPKYHFDADSVSAFFKAGKHNWEGQKTLEGKKVGWVRGYGYDQYLDVKVKVSEEDKREFGIKKVMNDRIDFLLDSELEIKTTVDELGLDESSYQIEEFLDLPLFLAFAGNDKGKKLAQYWDKRIEEMIADGSLKAIYEASDYTDYPY